VTFERALAYLSSLQVRGWRLGLDRMEEFIRRAELDSALGASGTPKYLHVAGTNGKGSVTAYLQAILTAAGKPTGGFFSPYVYDVRERIQLGCEPIPKEAFARIVARLHGPAESLTETEFGGVTEFELKTAMGLSYWQEQGAEWVALEVGLGGRLDATNVITPACSGIVTIGLDHTDVLGPTLDRIAREKAGIFKPGKPAVAGDLPPEAMQAAQAVAEQLGCPFWRYGRDFEARPAGEAVWDVSLPERVVPGVQPPLPGAHQAHNVAVALAMLEAAGAAVPEEAVRTGLARTRVPGRFERRTWKGREIVLDGAHNRESVDALAETLGERFSGRRFALVFGMLEGHDPAPLAEILRPLAAEVHLAPIGFRRTRDPSELAPLFPGAAVHTNSAAAIRAVLASGSETPVLVTGSFYLVGEVGNWLAASSSPSATLAQ
jgi:dihydrofolate synthase / folylpolyglutamate synthase